MYIKGGIFTVFLFALLSCGGNATTSTAVVSEEIGDSFNIEDSLKINPNLGDVVKREFIGNIPSDSYIKVECILLLYNQIHSGDGVYKLTYKYISVVGQKGRESIAYGKQYTLRGDKTNQDAIVYQLIPFNGLSPIVNLLYTNDNLEFLNEDFSRYKSNDYLLVRK